MKVVLIDDELHSIELLEYHLKKVIPKLEIVGKYCDPLDAIKEITKKNIDVLFLDIDMPEISGLEILSLLKNESFPVIFVTAYSKFAIDAIKLNAFDYILKPIDLKELIRIYLKLKSHFNNLSNTKKHHNENIVINISNRNLILKKESILNISSEGNYSTIFLSDKSPILITKNMKKMENLYFYELPFLRIHQSHIINTNHVVESNGHGVVLSDGKEIPVSKAKLNILYTILKI